MSRASYDSRGFGLSPDHRYTTKAKCQDDLEHTESYVNIERNLLVGTVSECRANDEWKGNNPMISKRMDIVAVE